MATAAERAQIAHTYKNGCFSRPKEPLEAFLQLSSTWVSAEPVQQWTYPLPVAKGFFEHFGVDLQKIPVEISSKGLMPWELACCWIDEEGRGTIQIRPQDKPSTFVRPGELLTHEAVHAVRGRLFSSLFEEHCAYAACYKVFPRTFPLWRTFLGPLFTSPKEVIILVCLIWGTWGVPMLMDWDVSYFLLGGLSFSYLLVPFARLVTRWRAWRRALNNIAVAWPNKEWKLIIRLSDEEILWLSRLRKADVRQAVHDKALQEWRWEYFLEEILE